MCMSAVDSVPTRSVFLRFVWGFFFTVSPFRPPTRDQPCLSVTRTTRRRWTTPPSRSTRASASTTIIWPRFWLLLCMRGWGANKHPVDLLWMMSFRLGLITQVFIYLKKKNPKQLFSQTTICSVWSTACNGLSGALCPCLCEGGGFLHCDLVKGIKSTNFYKHMEYWFYSNLPLSSKWVSIFRPVLHNLKAKVKITRVT